jgi:sialidase-1
VWPRTHRQGVRLGATSALRTLGMLLLAFPACGTERHVACAAGIDEQSRVRAVSILRLGLTDSDFWQSIHAAEGLTSAGYGQEVRQHLELRLADESDDRRRVGIARELVRAGDVSKVSVLTEIVRREDPYSHVLVIESLFKVGQIGDRQAIAKAYETTSSVNLRLMAAGALARLGDAESLAAIRQACSAEDTSSVRLAAWLLGQVGTADDVTLLRSRLGVVADDRTRSYLNHAMAALGDSSSQDALVDDLTADDPAIRARAATAVRCPIVDSLAPRLVEMLDDPFADAQYAAATAIAVCGRGHSEYLACSVPPC